MSQTPNRLKLRQFRLFIAKPICLLSVANTCMNILTNKEALKDADYMSFHLDGKNKKFVSIPHPLFLNNVCCVLTISSF